jgi:hypothetical protein
LAKTQGREASKGSALLPDEITPLDYLDVKPNHRFILEAQLVIEN